MRCEHYWRDGILLVERGRSDPHRDDCLECRREHEARASLVRALQQVGAGGGDPRWQARVWKQIEQERARASARPRWVPWASAFAVACVLVVIVQAGGLFHREREGDGAGIAIAAAPPVVNVAPAEHRRTLRADTAGSKRLMPASIGDHAQAWAAPDQEVRIYRNEVLLARCAAGVPVSSACVHGGFGVVVDRILELPGKYQLVFAPVGFLAAPADGVGAASLDHDLAELTAHGVGYDQRTILVR